MLERARKRLTYSNVVATIALFGVLAGGVAVGATVGKDSVGKKQLKDGAVIGKKLGDGAVKTGKLADGSVTTPKIADDAVTGAKVNEATLGTVPEAQSAATAVTAANALNSQALGGSPLAGVRSSATAVSEQTNVPLTGAPQTVMTTSITVPAGGGSVEATATIDIFTANIATSLATCQLEAGRDGTFAAIGQIVFGSLPGTPGFNAQIPAVGLKTNVPAGSETVRVQCQLGSGSDLTFDRGDLVLEVHPTG